LSLTRHRTDKDVAEIEPAMSIKPFSWDKDIAVVLRDNAVGCRGSVVSRRDDVLNCFKLIEDVFTPKVD